jgi:glutaminyl-tRNA synthetase
LFSLEEPDKNKDEDPTTFINPDSFSQVKGFIEPSLLEASEEDRFQFQRLGYFILDQKPENGPMVFNKTVGLRDTWKKD